MCGSCGNRHAARRRHTSASENIWHRNLLGLFLTVLLLIVGGFGLSMWELRHDQEMTAIGIPSRQ